MNEKFPSSDDELEGPESELPVEGNADQIRDNIRRQLVVLIGEDHEKINEENGQLELLVEKLMLVPEKVSALLNKGLSVADLEALVATGDIESTVDDILGKDVESDTAINGNLPDGENSQEGFDFGEIKFDGGYFLSQMSPDEEEYFKEIIKKHLGGGFHPDHFVLSAIKGLFKQEELDSFTEEDIPKLKERFEKYYQIWGYVSHTENLKGLSHVAYLGLARYWVRDERPYADIQKLTKEDVRRYLSIKGGDESYGITNFIDGEKYYGEHYKVMGSTVQRNFRMMIPDDIFSELTVGNEDAIERWLDDSGVKEAILRLANKQDPEDPNSKIFNVSFFVAYALKNNIPLDSLNILTKEDLENIEGTSGLDELLKAERETFNALDTKIEKLHLDEIPELDDILNGLSEGQKLFVLDELEQVAMRAYEEQSYQKIAEKEQEIKKPIKEVVGKVAGYFKTFFASDERLMAEEMYKKYKTEEDKNKLQIIKDQEENKVKATRNEFYKMGLSDLGALAKGVINSIGYGLTRTYQKGKIRQEVATELRDGGEIHKEALKKLVETVKERGTEVNIDEEGGYYVSYLNSNHESFAGSKEEVIALNKVAHKLSQIPADVFLGNGSKEIQKKAHDLKDEYFRLLRHLNSEYKDSEENLLLIKSLQNRVNTSQMLAGGPEVMKVINKQAEKSDARLWIDVLGERVGRSGIVMGAKHTSLMVVGGVASGAMLVGGALGYTRAAERVRDNKRATAVGVNIDTGQNMKSATGIEIQSGKFERRLVMSTQTNRLESLLDKAAEVFAGIEAYGNYPRNDILSVYEALKRRLNFIDHAERRGELHASDSVNAGFEGIDFAQKRTECEVVKEKLLGELAEGKNIEGADVVGILSREVSQKIDTLKLDTINSSNYQDFEDWYNDGLNVIEKYQDNIIGSYGYRLATKKSQDRLRDLIEDLKSALEVIRDSLGAFRRKRRDEISSQVMTALSGQDVEVINKNIEEEFEREFPTKLVVLDELLVKDWFEKLNKFDKKYEKTERNNKLKAGALGMFFAGGIAATIGMSMEGDTDELVDRMAELDEEAVTTSQSDLNETEVGDEAENEEVDQGEDDGDIPPVLPDSTNTDSDTTAMDIPVVDTDSTSVDGDSTIVVPPVSPDSTNINSDTTALDMSRVDQDTSIVVDDADTGEETEPEFDDTDVEDEEIKPDDDKSDTALEDEENETNIDDIDDEDLESDEEEPEFDDTDVEDSDVEDIAPDDSEEVELEPEKVDKEDDLGSDADTGEETEPEFDDTDVEDEELVPGDDADTGKEDLENEPKVDDAKDGGVEDEIQKSTEDLANNKVEYVFKDPKNDNVWNFLTEEVKKRFGPAWDNLSEEQQSKQQLVVVDALKDQFRVQVEGNGEDFIYFDQEGYDALPDAKKSLYEQSGDKWVPKNPKIGVVKPGQHIDFTKLFNDADTQAEIVKRIQGSLEHDLSDAQIKELFNGADIKSVEDGTGLGSGIDASSVKESVNSNVETAVSKGETLESLQIQADEITRKIESATGTELFELKQDLREVMAEISKLEVDNSVASLASSAILEKNSLLADLLMNEDLDMASREMLLNGAENLSSDGVDAIRRETLGMLDFAEQGLFNKEELQHLESILYSVIWEFSQVHPNIDVIAGEGFVGHLSELPQPDKEMLLLSFDTIADFMNDLVDNKDFNIDDYPSGKMNYLDYYDYVVNVRNYLAEDLGLDYNNMERFNPDDFDRNSISIDSKSFHGADAEPLIYDDEEYPYNGEGGTSENSVDPATEHAEAMQAIKENSYKSKLGRKWDGLVSKLNNGLDKDNYNKVHRSLRTMKRLWNEEATEALNNPGNLSDGEAVMYREMAQDFDAQLKVAFEELLTAGELSQNDKLAFINLGKQLRSQAEAFDRIVNPTPVNNETDNGILGGEGTSEVIPEDSTGPNNIPSGENIQSNFNIGETINEVTMRDFNKSFNINSLSASERPILLGQDKLLNTLPDKFKQLAIDLQTIKDPIQMQYAFEDVVNHVNTLVYGDGAFMPSHENEIIINSQLSKGGKRYLVNALKSLSKLIEETYRDPDMRPASGSTKMISILQKIYKPVGYHI